MPAFSQLLKLLRAPFLALGPLAPLMLVVFWVMAGISMVWAMLAVYAASLGAGATAAGALISAVGGARLLVNLPAGIASERWGRRKVMAVGLVTLSAGSFLTLGAASIPTLLVCLLIQGMGNAAYGTAALSAVTDTGTAQSRVRDMAAYQGAMLLGLSCGPGIGGIVASFWGYGAPFLVQGCLAILALLSILTVQPGPAGAPRRLPAHKGETKALLRRLAGTATMIYCAFFTRVATLWVLVPLMAKRDYGMSIFVLGIALTVSAMVNLAVLPFTGRLARRFGRKAMVVASNALVLAGLALLAFWQTQAAIWPVSIAFGVGTGLGAPLLSAYAADRAPPGRVGAVMGMVRTMSDLGVMTGPIFLGAFIDALGLGERGGIGLCTAVLVASTVFFALSSGERRGAS